MKTKHLLALSLLLVISIILSGCQYNDINTVGQAAPRLSSCGATCNDGSNCDCHAPTRNLVCWCQCSRMNEPQQARCDWMLYGGRPPDLA